MLLLWRHVKVLSILLPVVTLVLERVSHHFFHASQQLSMILAYHLVSHFLEL